MSSEFDDLKMPDEDFGMPPSEGMPDPTAQDQPPSDVEPEPKVLEEPEESEETPEAKPKGGGVMAVLRRADLFTVLLAVSLMAVLIAVFCLAMEWGSYSFERNPKVSAVAPGSRYLVGVDGSAGVRSGDHMVG